METDENELREQLCQAAGHLWQRGLVSGTRATVSVELHRRRYLVTPAGRRQAGLSPDDLVTIDLHGADLRGGRNPVPKVWTPHRIALDHGMRQTPEDIGAGRGRAIHATALVHPPRVLAFAAHATASGANGIKLRGHAPVPILDPADESVLLAAIKTYPLMVLTGLGVFAADASLDATLAVIEDAEAAAELTLTLQRLR